ncbi:glycoprotease (O-sialoglycoprotein endopeptidase) (plasmid) [Legionella adelaidensis]|uniref:tRNA threonylcarbamoyladenosine biosynthesis protein TsaB n=1 Tax=Legionella adelaidensis TaxID=45056 RepID=A0A0W0R363_9GAMM|nr:tRNA (adenosine(37)-N6)-threonylcarbamoyltransferase complex dimerization subunit type 1 TsaB [Legionella adelaidensis]KTC65466.1 O-sialoglycoprotein endopeptidase [Legionella adelaidensis]VEH84713.1 glycoprotease (O-sialoglycoprotein endopeptidase) [Legionella adelaidensis]
MKLLALDTSTDRASIALSYHNQIETREHHDIRQHAQFLLPMVEELLSSCDLSIKQLDGVVFGRGPGSFTGLRIGCSVAKALAYAADLPLYPVSTLNAIAQKIWEKGLTNVLAVIDARMHELYWAEIIPGKPFQEYVSAAEKIQLSTNEKYILAGVGYEVYESALSLSIKQQIMKKETTYPEAASMLQLVLNNKIAAVDADEALPVYIRDDVTQK